MKSPKQKRRLQVEPLQGRFFDMKPSSKPKKSIRKNKISRQAFLWIIFGFFVLMIGFRLWTTAQELLKQNKEAALQGISQLQQAVEAAEGRNLVGARDAFLSAQSAFAELNDSLQGLAHGFSPSNQNKGTLGSIQTLAQWSVEVSQLGADLATWAAKYTKTPPSLDALFAGNGSQLLVQLKEAQREFKPLFKKAVNLNKTLKDLNISFLNAQLNPAKAQFSTLMNLLTRLNAALEGARLLLGDQQTHDYLILFQNSNERRATGGFIGSVASIAVKNGVLGAIEPYDIYNIDRHLKELIPAPPGIDQVSGGRLYSRDANYWPDFPTSARTILQLMEKSGMPTFDTVVAIDQTVAETLLKYVPPLSTQDGVFEINAQTFSPLLQFYTEAKLSESINPKAFLFTLIPQMKERLAKVEDQKALTQDVLELVKRGHIQAYSAHPEAQLIFDELQLSGRLLTPEKNQDYIALVSTSVGGNKSDAYINTSIEHVTQIDPEGHLKNQVTLAKRHTWNETSWETFVPYLKHYGAGKSTPDQLRFILGEGGNLDYMRLYVPKGSVLSQVEGLAFESVKTYQEANHTVFAFNFGPVAPGALQQVKLTYDLPFSLSNGRTAYSFLAQPQAAAQSVFLKKDLQLSEGWKVLGGRSGLGSVVDQVPKLDVLFEGQQEYQVDLLNI